MDFKSRNGSRETKELNSKEGQDHTNYLTHYTLTDPLIRRSLDTSLDIVVVSFLGTISPVMGSQRGCQLYNLHCNICKGCTTQCAHRTVHKIFCAQNRAQNK